MKKILSLAIFLTFVFPTVSYAAWWNPFSWNLFKQTVTTSSKIVEPISSENLNGFKSDEGAASLESGRPTPGFISDEEMAKIEQQDAKVKAEKEDVLLWKRLVLANDGYKILNPEVKGKVIKFFKTYKKYDPKYGTGDGSAYKQINDKWWDNFDIHKGDTADRLYSAHQDLLAETSGNMKKKNPMFLGKECLDEYCSLEIKMEVARRGLESPDYYSGTRRPRTSTFIDETSSSLSSDSSLGGYSNNHSSTFSTPDFSSASYNPATFVPQNTPRSSFDITPTAGAGSYYTDSFGTTRYSGEGTSGSLRADSLGNLRYEDSSGYSATIKTDPFGGIRYSGNGGTSGTIKTDPLGTIHYQSSDGVSGTIKTDPFGNTRYYNSDGGTLTCRNGFLGATNCY